MNVCIGDKLHPFDSLFVKNLSYTKMQLGNSQTPALANALTEPLKPRCKLKTMANKSKDGN